MVAPVSGGRAHLPVHVAQARIAFGSERNLDATTGSAGHFFGRAAGSHSYGRTGGNRRRRTLASRRGRNEYVRGEPQTTAGQFPQGVGGAIRQGDGRGSRSRQGRQGSRTRLGREGSGD